MPASPPHAPTEADSAADPAAAIDRRLAAGERVVLFDGVCSLCNGTVDLLLARDARRRLAFGSLQSDGAQAYLARAGRDADALLDSVVLIDGDGVHERSEAALRIARALGGPWALLAGLRVVPAPVRDAVYDWVAARRYRWFGRRETCRLPSPAERDRFV